MTNPIRRNSDFPRDRAEIFDKRFRLPKLLSGNWQELGYNVRYKLTRQRKLWGEEDYIVSLREIVARVLYVRQIVGAVKLIEWHCKPWADPGELMESMDGWSKEAFDLADAICCNWSIGDIFELGPVVEFRLAWSHPEMLEPGLIWKVAEGCIDLLDAHYSLLILKALPLEYENDTEGCRAALTRRRRAMQRMYCKVLDAKPLPNEWGQDGWMWRKNHPTIELNHTEPN